MMHGLHLLVAFGAIQSVLAQTEFTPPFPRDDPSLSMGFCPNLQPPTEHNSAVLDQLSPEEVKSVAEYLEAEFDLIREEPANLTDCHYVNRLFKVTKFPPPKVEVLDYLDNGGPPPARYAEAMIIRAPIDIMHYKVGPLPLVEGSVEVIPVTQDGEIPWGSRPYVYGCERSMERVVIDPVLEILAPIFKATANGYCMVGEGCREGMSLSLTADPLSSPFNRLSVVRFRIQPSVFEMELDDTTGSPASSMFVIPLTFKLHHTGPDTSSWFVSELEYCGQGPFSSAEELFGEWEFGQVQTCHTGLTDDYDATWSHLGVSSISVYLVCSSSALTFVLGFFMRAATRYNPRESEFGSSYYCLPRRSTIYC